MEFVNTIDLADVVILVAGLLGFIWLYISTNAARTAAKWDDKLVDIVEGLADNFGLDPDDLARQSTGVLKDKVVQEVEKKLKLPGMLSK